MMRYERMVTGEFGTHMNVSINNDGPVTIIYESQDGKIQ
ncbi:D-tyrosyl-tRNA(Tyr) deacylase [Staphylococcus aureus M0869]|nr:D-tyrosyl-tRNA(Tyr) deacylase [Staphylococcus aureus M0528]ENL06878.1 D-tyrosyl-tRNA(Tyr) deacylase [Staphylococcus aureus M0687]EUD24991.1 D-tyrosyl-tRNA(Tyr) deacylase [Staphylococcus aureus M0741]EUD26591.1 D-tyrosyl-tRNA(Tyr) deacylase [Staphylococcus aureus M0728]EUE68095.1 D-tyrosyl-tRNA(Tyr) deacylase [Staphylococcus aureus M0681]EUF08136.1 D-tyrosyl-tRNA(Tyr) deacylase [Staphylococcus aureus M0706]EUG08779.1 D-tyrosyl-tRNA(Tyr) deacylase [Staphylococcus aureus M0551]EUL23333.1 D-t